MKMATAVRGITISRLQLTQLTDMLMVQPFMALATALATVAAMAMAVATALATEDTN